jgi:hypothetical protein
MAMTQADIQRIMDKHPELNDFGIGVYDDKQSPAERAETLAKEKSRLLESVDACNRVCEWLRGIERIKSINWDQSSYGLKHLAERDSEYCTNGVFITAAIHSGFPYRIKSDSPNVWFGMSAKSINAIRDRQNHVVR